jgi:Flp pilus assembly protein TadD
MHVPIPEEESVSIRLSFLFSLGVMAAAQEPFPMYDVGTRSPVAGMPSYDSTLPVPPHPGRWHNVEAPDDGAFVLTPRPPDSPGVSADQLRHPLAGKALKMIHKVETLIAAHDYVHAREELKKAAKDQAAAPYAHSLLGQEYVRNSQFADAVTELEQAIQLLPSSVPDHANLGYALLMTGKVALAEKELRRALELQPVNPRTHLVLGLVCYTDRSRDKETAEHLEFAARELPGARLMLAKFYRLTGRMDDADREFQAYQQSAGPEVSALARQWFENGGQSSALR